jgi:hypothetical protein
VFNRIFDPSDEMTLKLVLHVEDREELWNTRSSSYKRGDKRGFMDISRNETGSEIHGKFLTKHFSFLSKIH